MLQVVYSQYQLYSISTNHRSTNKMFWTSTEQHQKHLFSTKVH